MLEEQAAQYDARAGHWHEAAGAPRPEVVLEHAFAVLFGVWSELTVAAELVLAAEEMAVGVLLNQAREMLEYAGHKLIVGIEYHHPASFGIADAHIFCRSGAAICLREVPDAFGAEFLCSRKAAVSRTVIDDKYLVVGERLRQDGLQCPANVRFLII